MSRGIINNNPGNIRISAERWKGKIPNAQNSDKVFEQFTTLAFGVRALIVLLRNYVSIYNLDTLTKILHKYAPGFENNTEAYIKTVSQRTGIAPNQVINFNDPATIKKVITAIAWVENGKLVPGLDIAIIDALDMLGIEKKKKLPPPLV